MSQQSSTCRPGHIRILKPGAYLSRQRIWLMFQLLTMLSIERGRAGGAGLPEGQWVSQDSQNQFLHSFPYLLGPDDLASRRTRVPGFVWHTYMNQSSQGFFFLFRLTLVDSWSFHCIVFLAHPWDALPSPIPVVFLSTLSLYPSLIWPLFSPKPDNVYSIFLWGLFVT